MSAYHGTPHVRPSTTFVSRMPAKTSSRAAADVVVDRHDRVERDELGDPRVADLQTRPAARRRRTRSAASRARRSTGSAARGRARRDARARTRARGRGGPRLRGPSPHAELAAAISRPCGRATASRLASASHAAATVAHARGIGRRAGGTAPARDGAPGPSSAHTRSWSASTASGSCRSRMRRSRSDSAWRPSASERIDERRATPADLGAERCDAGRAARGEARSSSGIDHGAHEAVAPDRRQRASLASPASCERLRGRAAPAGGSTSSGMTGRDPAARAQSPSPTRLVSTETGIDSRSAPMIGVVHQKKSGLSQ